jgi:capsular polysaccharide biosynthesis protein
MSPQVFTPELARACVGSDSNAARRSLVNSMQIDILDDSGGVLAISVRLVGADHAKECANLLAKNIVDTSDAALTNRLLEDGFTAVNLQKGKINNYEKPMITSQPRMSDSYVRPQMAQTMLGAFLMGLISVLAYSILKRRYFSG